MTNEQKLAELRLLWKEIKKDYFLCAGWCNLTIADLECNCRYSKIKQEMNKLLKEGRQDD